VHGSQSIYLGIVPHDGPTNPRFKIDLSLMISVRAPAAINDEIRLNDDVGDGLLKIAIMAHVNRLVHCVGDLATAYDEIIAVGFQITPVESMLGFRAVQAAVRDVNVMEIGRRNGAAHRVATDACIGGIGDVYALETQEIVVAIKLD